jgi:hypothetical protein
MLCTVFNVLIILKSLFFDVELFSFIGAMIVTSYFVYNELYENPVFKIWSDGYKNAFLKPFMRLFGLQTTEQPPKTQINETPESGNLDST